MNCQIVSFQFFIPIYHCSDDFDCMLGTGWKESSAASITAVIFLCHSGFSSCTYFSFSVITLIAIVVSKGGHYI